MKLARRTWSFLLPAIVLLSGCKAPPPSPPSPAEERPHCRDEARWWEEQGNKELTYGYRTESLAIRLRAYDAAIRDLRHSRDLYYAELEYLENLATKENPIPTGRREALDIEIERLSRQIDVLHKERPLDPHRPIDSNVPVSRRTS